MEKSKAFGSKLIPYMDIIIKARKSGLSYAKIAQNLQLRFGIIVHRDTIHSFVKVRSKKRKVYEIKEVRIKPEIIGKNARKTKELENVSTFDFSTFTKGAKSQAQVSNPKFNYDETKPIK